MPFGVVVGAIGSIVSSSNAADASDNATRAQERTADGQLALGREQLDFNKSVYSDGKGARDFALDAATKTSAAQLREMQFATDSAQEQQDYRTGTFEPLEKGLVKDAEGYDTAQRRNDASAAAQADVNQAYDANKLAAERDLARSGIAPGSAKAMSIMADGQYAQANAGAAAGTKAVRDVEAAGVARRSDVANLGRNLASNQATQQQIATNSGTAGVNSAVAGVNAQMAGVPNVNAGYTGAVDAGRSAGGLYGQAAGAYGATAAFNAGGFTAAARALGSGRAPDFGAMANYFNFGRSGNNYNGSSGDVSAPNYQNGSDMGITFADGGPVRDEPVVGTKGPVKSGGTSGGLSKEAIAAAIRAVPSAPDDGNIGKLSVDPLNPKAVIESRLKAQGLAYGGRVRWRAAPIMNDRVPQPLATPAGFGPVAAVAPAPHAIAGMPMAGTMGGAPTRVDGVPQGAQAAPIAPMPMPAAPMPAAPAMPPAWGGVDQSPEAGPAAPAAPQEWGGGRAGGGLVNSLGPAAPAAPQEWGGVDQPGAPMPSMPSAAPAPRATVQPIMGGARATVQPVMGGARQFMAMGGAARRMPVDGRPGGRVVGPGGPRDDMVPANLSNNEHVVTAREIKSLGGGKPELGHARMKVLRKQMVAMAHQA